MHGSRHYYEVQITDNEVIDASSTGSVARFANHSCAPNATLERWEVNGEICCGLFAAALIQRGTEITFSYLGTGKKSRHARPCFCGDSTCRGYVPK
nr:hypothetical protein PF009_g32360 [Phytophthora fragariae]